MVGWRPTTTHTPNTLQINGQTLEKLKEIVGQADVKFGHAAALASH